MKKKVTVSFKDGDLIFRGCNDKTDDCFINMYCLNAIKIVRQYYPLKNNEPEVIFIKKDLR